MFRALLRGYVVQRLVRAASDPRNQERARQAYRSARANRSARRR